MSGDENTDFEQNWNYFTDYIAPAWTEYEWPKYNAYPNWPACICPYMLPCGSTFCSKFGTCPGYVGGKVVVTVNETDDTNP